MKELSIKAWELTDDEVRALAAENPRAELLVHNRLSGKNRVKTAKQISQLFDAADVYIALEERGGASKRCLHRLNDLSLEMTARKDGKRYSGRRKARPNVANG